MKKHLLMLFVAVMAASMSLNAQTIVIDDGFENGIQDSVWTQEFVKGHTAWAVEDISDGLSYPNSVKQGTKRAYLRNNTGETQGYVTRLVSRVMDLNPRKVYQPELSFWYANPKWTADRDTLRVYYRTGKNAKWNQLAEFSTAMANWQKVKIELPEVGPTYQIAFEGKDNLGRGIVLDSILVRSAPECTVPHDIVVSNKGANRVNISWSASWDANYFELIVSKDTINPNELDQVPAELIAYHGLVSGLQQNKNLTLESGEYYYVYVRSLCENETSIWSSEASEKGAYGFRVHATKAIPYFCDFNYPSTQSRDPEWTWGNNTGKEQPFVNSKQSASQRAYYSKDASPAVIFSGTAKTAVVPEGKYVYLATPALADTTNDNFHISQCQVHFWSTVYIYTGRQYGRSIIVGVMEDPEDLTTFRAVDTVMVWGNQSFVENIVDLGSYKGYGAYVAFMSDFDRPNHFFIDDVTIEYRPAVSKVTQISVNPRDTYADITWEGNASSYNVLVTNAEVDPSNPDATAVVAQVTVNTNSYHCTGLEAFHSWNKPYYVYVQAVGADWSYRYPFVTLAKKRAIPYTFDFEPTSGRYKIGTGSTYYVDSIGIFGNDPKYPSLSSTNVYKGSGCLTMTKTAGADTWVTLPMVEDLDSVQVKFFLGGTSATFGQAHATLGVMTNPMDINTFTAVSSFTLNTAGYTMCYANFQNYKGSKDGVIAIVWDDIMGLAQSTINYIDELKVEQVSECTPPQNFDVEVMADSVEISWSASPQIMWEVAVSRTPLTTAQKEKTFAEIKALGQVVYADTLVWTDDTTDPWFGIGDLRPQTDYVLYIRTVCGGEAAWWTERAFTTPCENAPFPFKETFESCTTSPNLAAPQLGCWQMADYLNTTYPIIYDANGGKTLELWSTTTTHRNVAIMPPVNGNLNDMMLTFETRSWSTTASSVLYVGSMRDINDENSFVAFDTIYNTGGSAFQKVKLILADYSIRYDNIAFSSGLGAVQTASDVLIDNIELRDATCLEAYNFRQTDAQPTSATFAWDGLSKNDEWELRILNKNVSLANVASGNYDTAKVAVINDTVITGRTFHVQDLNPVSTYYVYIRVFCGDSIWTGFQIQTACELFNPTKPNKETFESYSSGTSYNANYQATCWTVGNGSTTTSTSYIPYIHNSTSYASSGKNTYRLYGTSSYSPAYIVSPEIDITHMKELAVTFNMYATTSYRWVCGVMSDPEDLNTFVVIDSLKGTGASVQYTYDLSEYQDIIPPTAKYFAWRTPFDETSYAYLDDVSIIKMTCPLTKPSYSDLTAQTVRINSGLRSDDEWILLLTSKEISVDSLLSPTYVVPDSIVVFNETIDVRSWRVTGLDEQTKYFIYTATVCDNTINHWSNLSFTTPCMAIAPETMRTITFSTEEGFVPGSGTSRYLPCWTIGSKTPGVSASSSYIPYVGTTSSTMHNGHNYLHIQDYVYGTSSNYVGAYAIMPELNVDSINKYQVNFWGRGYSSSSYNSQIIIGVVSDPSDLNTFVAVDTLNLSHTGWEYFNVGFDNYEGDFLGNMGRNIMFLSEFGATNYAYISEISVSTIPTCRPISSFKVDSVGEDAAVVSWRGNQDSYRLLVADKILDEDEKASYPYLIDSIVYHNNNIRLTNLNAATNYYVYAQGICSKTDSTDISMQYAAFRTECPTSTGVPLPFFDDFESYPTGNEDVGCWLFRNVSGSYYPAIYSVSNMNTQAVELYSSSSGQSWMVVPALDGSLADMKLEFDARTWSTSASGTHYVRIGVMADPEDPTTYVELTTCPLTASSEFSHFEIVLGDYDIPYERLVFTSGLGVLPTSCDVYVDNVSLTMESPCHAPKLKTNAVSFNDVEVEIIPAKAENDLWDVVAIADSIYLKIKNLEKYLDTTSTQVRTSVRVLTLDKLEPATLYHIFARTLCGGDYGNSKWSNRPLDVHTSYYFENDYHFGFEKSEAWERSMYSTSDNYYIHPALATGRDTLGAESTSYSSYPYSMENTSSSLYAHTGMGALTINASGSYFGEYIIFPAIDKAAARSFELKIRPGYLLAASKQITSSSDGVLEIGTINKGKDYDSYERLATIRVKAVNSSTKADSANNFLFYNYAIDLDEELIAQKQIVLHAPQQPDLASLMFVDEVKLDKTKGFSLVSLKKVTPGGTFATVEWDSIGGPWNLFILSDEGDTVAQYLNLTATSQLVENLNPRTEYTALLSAANIEEGAENYTMTTQLAFMTTCQVMEPDSHGEFVWDFDDPYEWEANDVLAGVPADTLYMKPNCFHVGITYETPANGYQWLVQRKGFDYTSAALPTSAAMQYEVGRNDSHAMRIFTTESAFNSYIVLPEMNCSFDTMMIEFYGRCFVNYDETHAAEANQGKIVNTTYLGAQYNQSIVVGTLTNPNDFSTLQVLDTLTYKQTGLTPNDNVNNDTTGLRYWELMQLPLGEAQGKYIVLFQPAAGLFILDDLSIKPAGNTLFAPTHLRTTGITPNSAVLNWDVHHPNLATVVVILNASNEEVQRDTVSGTTCTVANLKQGTSFQWLVYQTDTTHNTPVSVTIPFATECVTIAPDYTCGFEMEDGWEFIPNQTNYLQTLCWTYGDAIQGTWKKANYDPYNMANTDDYRYSRTDSFALVMRAASSYQPYVALPAMDIAAFDTLQLNFWMRPAYTRQGTGTIISQYTGSTYSKSVIVGTMTDPTDVSTFVAIDTVTYDGTLSTSDIAGPANDYLFQQKKVVLEGATGPYVAIMTSFYAKGSATKRNSDYVWLDDISFSHRQLCKDPMDLHVDHVGATEATLSWIGGDSVFVLQVSKDANFAHDTAFVFNDTVYSNPYTVTGLEKISNYAWRVMALCGENLQPTGFSPKSSFTTIRSPYFLEEFISPVSTKVWTFSTSKADDILNKGIPTSTTDNSYGFKRVTNNNGLKGPHYTSVGFYMDFNWMITPEFYLPLEDSVHFSFDLALTACNTSNQATANPVSELDMTDDYYFMIVISDDGGKTWKRENILAKWQNTNPEGMQLRDIPATGMTARVSLAAFAGKNVRIGLYREARSSVETGIAIHVDNIRLGYFDKVIEYAEGCQYDDIVIGDIVLPGDETKPGLHLYQKAFYATDEAAKAGQPDTVYSLEVEVFEVSESSYEAIICEGDTYSDFNFLQPKDKSGIYRRKLQSVHGCDSIISLLLNVIPRAYAEDEIVSLCPGETYRWNGKTYNRAGIFRDTLVSAAGCDSIETLVLSYYKAEDTISVTASIWTNELPYTYVNEDHPYAPGQAPIYYPVGTAAGTYSDTVRVVGENCETILVHKLRIVQAQGIDNIFDENAAGARKIIYRDNLYIILNDEWYNAEGKKVADPRK